jgi:hypothetical protein
MEGADVTRGAAERAAGECIWVPTVLIGTPAAQWTVTAPDRIALDITTDAVEAS